jgi:hypothetical protein
VTSPQVIVAESAPPTPEDERKRELVSQLLDSENGRLIDVAKHLATTCFSAVGVVLALHDKWVPAAAPPRVTTLLASAIVLYLGAGVSSLFSAGAYVHRVTLADYEDVDAERHRVATIRYRLVIAALVLFVTATLLISAVALGS